MSEFQIYHNPRCSKSRQTLALLEENGIEAEIVLYLETPPNPPELRRILLKLGLSARDILRRGEVEYKEQNLADKALGEGDLVARMCQYPKLIERPIVVSGERAVLGRPPENVLDIIAS